MAEEPSKTPGTSAERPSPQIIPLSKIHDLPGVFIPKQPDKSYGGLVSSIQASGVKEPVILRLREDGEYQLVSGSRTCPPAATTCGSWRTRGMSWTRRKRPSM